LKISLGSNAEKVHICFGHCSLGGEKVNGKSYFVSAARDGTAVDLQNEGLKDFSLTLIGVPREIPLGHVGLKSIMRVRKKLFL
jgi:hypothetical protein